MRHKYSRKLPLKLNLLVISTVTLLLSTQACSNGAIESYSSQSKDIEVTEIAAGLKSPWGLAFLPNSDALITEKEGKLQYLSKSGELRGPVTGLPEVVVKGQGGMLGIAIHPDFANNQRVYVCLNAAGDGGVGSEVHAGTLKGMQLVDVEPIFVAKPKVNSGYHFGCRLTFDKDKFLYISLGDRGEKELAQDVTTHFGKVIRVNDDGSIPLSNPFVGKTGLDDIYSYGHRNVQGMTLHPETGEVWTHEHGPKGGDEINILSAGANYGWPEITYGVNYSGTIISDKTAMPGMRQPLSYWDPSIAPSGMTFYNGEVFPQWQNHLLIGSLKFQHLRLVKLDDKQQVISEHELLRERNERIRDVVQAPDGSVYLLTDSANGKVLKLTPRA